MDKTLDGIRTDQSQEENEKKINDIRTTFDEASRVLK
jgi:hypothetical protein